MEQRIHIGRKPHTVLLKLMIGSNDTMKRIALIIVLSLVSITLHARVSFAGIEIMSDEELSDVDAQFSTVTVESWNTENDTIRMFMDVHMEVYGTIESVRAGYYTRSSSEMRTNMAQIGLSGFEKFYDLQGETSDGTRYYNDGANFNFAKITSDFNTMAPQGAGTIEPWGNGGIDSRNSETLLETLTPNTNYTDWDLWIDNIRLGESPDKPMYMNGMIMRVEFDDSYDAEGAQIQRLIIGTNDQQGNFYSNMQRYTGIVNPMLLAYTAGRSLGVADPYEYTPGTMQMIRDSYIQCFGINIFNVEDRDTGMWMIMNMEGDHIGFEMINGLPENAIDFSYTQGVWDIPLWDPDWSPMDDFSWESVSKGAGVNEVIYRYRDWVDTGQTDPYQTRPQWENGYNNLPVPTGGNTPEPP